MCSTSFLKVTDESGMTLADLIPVGYKDVPEWADEDREGFRSQLTVKVLNAGGGLETDSSGNDKCYKFYAPWEDDEWLTPYWTLATGGKQTKIADASKIQFPVGTGLWIEMASGAYFSGKYPEDTYKIQHSGAAMLDARQVELRPGSKGVSITVSANITLANIHPVGYLTVPEWADEDREGFRSQITVKVLNAGGGLETDGSGNDKCYKFYAPWEDDEWLKPYWTLATGGKQTKITDASKIEFPIGTGLWIEVAAGAYFPYGTGKNKYPDNQYKVEFDGIENL